jgi:hypothetical protein
MSNPRFSILQARAVSDKRITDAQFRTLAALGTFTDEEGWCWPSLTTIGEMCGKTKQTAGRDVIALKKLGYLEIYPRYREDGSRTSSKYRLKFDLPPQHDGRVPPQYDSTLQPSRPDVTTHRTTQGKGDLVDAILQMASPKELAEKMAVEAFEKALGVTGWPFYTKTSFERLRRFITKIHQEQPNAFQEFASWRNSEAGMYKAMSNKQIRLQPEMFMDTGWPDFLASRKPAQQTRPKGEGFYLGSKPIR